MDGCVRLDTTFHGRLLVVALLGATLLVAAPRRAEAGPWTPQKWHAYVKGWLRWLPGFGLYDGNNTRNDFPAYHELSLNVYGELGLWGGLAVTLNMAPLRLFTLDDPRPGESASANIAPPDPTIGLRWCFVQRAGFAFAAAAAVKLPLATGDPVQTVYKVDGSAEQLGELRIGTGVFDFPLALHAGYAAERWWVAASFGVIFRTGDFTHDATWSLEGGGWFFSRHLLVAARFHGRHPTGSVPADYPPSPSGIGNGTSYAGFALEAGYGFGKGWLVGMVLEGGLIAVKRQSGGPVLAPFVSKTF